MLLRRSWTEEHIVEIERGVSVHGGRDALFQAYSDRQSIAGDLINSHCQLLPGALTLGREGCASGGDTAAGAASGPDEFDGQVSLSTIGG